MNPWDAWVTALKSLTVNKLRSSLTMLGIVIGVVAVVALMSVGIGAQNEVLSRIEGMGTNLLFVRPGAPAESGIRSALGSAPTLTLEDAEAIADPSAAPSVALVAPEASISGQVISDYDNRTTRVMGTTPDYELVRNFTVQQGSFISEQDMTVRSRVAVLGVNVAEALFPDGSPVGQSIRINDGRFEVIGVLEPKGGGGLGFEDDVVIVPLSTLQSRLAPRFTVRGGHIVQVINVQIVSQQEMDAATEQVAAILRERHRLSGEDDFIVTSQADIISSLGQITGILTVLLGSIAGISLLVGGIGVMNIMLVSVTERTREIGIRKAVGAKRRDILLQFLIESAVLTLSGGAVGIVLGGLLARLISRITIQGQNIPATVSPEVVILAFSVSAGIGLFFGVYPAFRAGRLHPIEALRHE